ncbi:Protein of unknown function [Gryllus bimaculatus]|nr:Protein of unknown function [Gryllus bimaculatus]
MSLLALFTVGSFHNELSKEFATTRGYVYPPTYVPPPLPYPQGVSVVTYGGYPYGQPPPSQQPPPFQPSPQMQGPYSTKTTPPGTMEDWATTK